MKETPPCLASAMASFSPETDCMMAETIGMFMARGHSSWPLRYFDQRGLEADTAIGDTLGGRIAGNQQVLTERYGTAR